MPAAPTEATAAHVRLLQAPDAAQSARHEAFGALVAAYQDMACGYALAQLGNWPAAKDAAQDAFILAYQQIGQLREPAAFGAWLKRIVWSQCQRARRAPRRAPARRRGRAARPHEAGPEPALGPPPGASRCSPWCRPCPVTNGTRCCSIHRRLFTERGGGVSRDHRARPAQAPAARPQPPQGGDDGPAATASTPAGPRATTPLCAPMQLATTLEEAALGPR